MNETLTFDVSGLIHLHTGANEIYSFDGPVKLDGLKLKSNVTGKVTIMRIEEGIHAAVTEFSVKIEAICDKCLKNFTNTEKIRNFDRIFYFEKPAKVEDINDLFLVDKKHLSIDLTEALRQEIILHFPVISVCSGSCKGLCPVCGKDRNKTKCSCKVEAVEVVENKPLAGLKDLIS